MNSKLKTQPRPRVRSSATDRAFDMLVPPALRHLSRTHWTPVSVAVRATTLLGPRRDTRILDVGSGVGKLCAIGALSSRAIWCGIEHHESLVISARRLARALGIAERTMFLHGDAFGIEWGDFEALYLYNPFELPLVPDAGILEAHTVDYHAQITRVQDRLAALRVGTRVVTFHGFGGVMPPTYDLVYHERVPVVGLDLVLWIQRSRARRTVAFS